MRQFFVWLQLGLAVICLGLIGWVIGAYLGGNYAVNFVIKGLRGYEASGLIGSIAGTLAGMLWVLSRRVKQRK